MDYDSVQKFTVIDKNRYLDSLLNRLSGQKNDSNLRSQYFQIANRLFYIGEVDKSRDVSLKVLNLSIAAKDTLNQGKAFFYIGDSFKTTRTDSAYYYYHQAEKCYQKKLDYVEIARMQFSKAVVLFYDGNYIACEVQLSKALKNLNSGNDLLLLYSVNSLLGNCLEKTGDYDEALKYHAEALRNVEKFQLSKNLKSFYKVSTTINISNLYDIKEDYEKSISILEDIIQNDLINSKDLFYARVLSNLAYSKFKNKEYPGVQSMFLESIKIADSLGQDSDLLYKYIYFGEFYASQQDTLLAVHYLKKANTLATKNSNTNEILSTLKLLAKLDTKKSLAYSTKYINLSDNVNLLQKKTRNKYARIEYETTKIEDANKTLSRNNIIIIIVAIVLIAFLLTFIIVRYIKYKNKELLFLRKQEKASEDIFNLLTEQQKKINQAKETEKTKIAQELHDGVMNALYGIRLNLGFFNSKQDAEAVEKRKNYIEELKKVEADIRTISHDLSRNTFFDSSDFNTLLSNLIENQQEISSTRFSYINSDNFKWNKVPNLCKINLYRIFQEAILNVNKYAKAENCIISIQQREKNHVRILIQDDGIGFDTKAKRNGIGHNNMMERVKNIGGQINITSEIGKGTTIEIIFDFTYTKKRSKK
ncbi:MAG: ATP-binding protein [Flavobacterium sp.]